MKKVIVLALCALAVLSFAGEKKKSYMPKVYGKINVSYGVEDINGSDSWELNSHASRVGVKGSYPVNDGLDIVYKLEWEVDVTDSSKSSSDHIKARNQFAGLKGSFGTFLAGRHDTPIKLAQGKFDLFNDGDSDIKTLTASEIRASNVVAYASPKLGDMATVMIAVVPGEEPNGEDGPADTVTANLVVEKNGFYGAIGALDADSATYLRGVVYYKSKAFQIGALFESDEAGDFDEDAIVLNGAYSFDNLKFKVQLGNSDIGSKGKGLGNPLYQGVESLSVGLDYKLNKNAGLYTYYVTTDDDGKHEADYLKVGGVFKF